MYKANLKNFLLKIQGYSSAYFGVKAWRQFNLIWDTLYLLLKL